MIERRLIEFDHELRKQMDVFKRAVLIGEAKLGTTDDESINQRDSHDFNASPEFKK